MKADDRKSLSLKDGAKHSSIMCNDKNCTKQHYDLEEIVENRWTDNKLKPKPIKTTWLARRSIH